MLFLDPRYCGKVRLLPVYSSFLFHFEIWSWFPGEILFFQTVRLCVRKNYDRPIIAVYSGISFFGGFRSLSLQCIPIRLFVEIRIFSPPEIDSPTEIFTNIWGLGSLVATFPPFVLFPLSFESGSSFVYFLAGGLSAP